MISQLCLNILLFNGLLVVFIQQEDMLYTDYQIAISSFCDFWRGRWKGSQDIRKQVSDISAIIFQVLIGEGVLDSLRKALASPYFGPGPVLPQTILGNLEG